MNREKKLARNSLIIGLGTAVSSGLSFLLVPIFSRWLTASDYGTYDLYNTYVSVLLPFLTLSSGEAAFRFLLDGVTDHDKRRVVNSATLIALIGTVLGTVAIAVFFWNTASADILPFVSLMLASILYRQCCYYARGLRMLKAYTFSNVVYLIAMAAGVTWLVYGRGMMLHGMIYGTAIGYLAGSVYLTLATRMWRYTAPQKPDVAHMRKLALYAMPLIPSAISWWIVNVSDRAIINLFLGAAANGVYAIAYKVPSLCTTMFSIFHISWQESAVDAIHDDDRCDYVNRVMNRIMPIVLSIGMGVLAVNRYMYRWVWDTKYADGYFHVCILVTAVLFAFFAQYLGGVLVAQKRTKANGITIVIAAAINVALNVALIQWIGLYAASGSTLVSYAAMLAMRIALIRKEFPVRVQRTSWVAILCYAAMVASQFVKGDAAGVAALAFAIVAAAGLNRATIMHLVRRVFKIKKA